MKYKHLFSLFALPLCVILLITLAMGVTAASNMDTTNFTFKDDFTSVQSEVTAEGSGSGNASVSGAVFSLEATGVNATSGCNATPAKPATTTVTLVPANAVAITYSYTGSISVTASVTDNEDGTYTVIVGAGEAFQFSVNAENATKASGKLTIESIAETASKKPADRAIFSVDSTPYDYLDDAIEAAKTSTSKLIIVERDGAAYHSSYESKDDNDGVYDKTFTIPSGVTLLVPFNGNNNYYTDAVAYAGEVMETPTAFRTLILPEDTQFIIDGSMNVAGKFAYTNSGGQSGSPSGYLGFVEMESDSNITVNGSLYAYGYITGDGTVTVNSGGSVYEILQMPEFRGGSQSTSMKNNVFPLSQFYVQNIEVPMTIYQGATEETFANVYVYGGGLVNKYFPTGITLFGSGGMFELGAKDQYAKKWYDPSTDRLHIEINGDVTMNSIELVMDASILGSKSINSEDYVLPINGAFTIHIKTGSLTVPSTQEVLLQPGAQVIIDEGASVTVNSALYVYDAAQWGAYCSWGHANAGTGNCWDTPVIPVSYSPTRTYTRPFLFPRSLITDTAGNAVYISTDKEISQTVFDKNTGNAIAADDLREFLGNSDYLPDASILVNGTLTGNIYTTSSGANIYSTESGVFTQTATGTADVYQLMMATDCRLDENSAKEVAVTDSDGNTIYYVKESATQAQLKNSDDTFVTTATDPTTYNYIDGKWVAADCGRLDIVATNIAVNDGLDVHFYVDKADMETDTTYTAVITKSFADNRTPVTKFVASDSWKEQKISDTVTYMYFTFEDVSAKEMMDNIEVKIYTDYVDAANPGIQVSNTFVETIQNYAIRTLAPILTAIEKQTATKEDLLLASALADMLQYGAAAQVHFKYNTEQLATEEPESPAEKYQGVLAKGCGYATDSPVEMVSNRTNGNNFKGVTVSATNTLMFTFYFGIENPEGMYAQITYTDGSNTGHVLQEVQGTAFYARTPGSLYGVDVTELSIVDGRQLLTCTVYNADGSTYGSATDSIEGYAARKSDSTDEAIDIFERIMMFVDSAGAYFEQVSQSSGG